MKTIEIDIDVHRCIENARLDFEESENKILRRLLRIEPEDESQSRFKISSGHIPDINSLKEPLRSNTLSDEISEYQASAIARRMAEIDNAAIQDWIYGGVRLPEGTKLQKWSGSEKHEAVISNGSILVNGEQHQSPSSAAMAVNGKTNVNGWIFWEYFNRETQTWEKLDQLRKLDERE